MRIDRYFTKDHRPYDKINWVNRLARIKHEDEIIFEQKNVEFPDSWSQSAIDITASKYFNGQLGAVNREYSLNQLIDRVVNTLVTWGIAGGYFSDPNPETKIHESYSYDDPISSNIFRDELKYILVYQMASFNSPVWFNCGLNTAKPQLNACFINSVEDNIESIIELQRDQIMIYKWGSGTGVNLSNLRSSMEPLSDGGYSSGPIAFLRGLDAWNGIIKSGGKTRRAAALVCLDCDHPDIVEFIKCKAEEEKKARYLTEKGYASSLDEVYKTLFFQNANHSVRVTDEFMKLATSDQIPAEYNWKLPWRTDPKKYIEVNAHQLLRLTAEAAYKCGDPGLQFHDTINTWHTCKNSGRISSSNACSEFVFLDNTPCNLASINLMKFRNPNGSFNTEDFRHVVDIMILAQEIMIDNVYYPTEIIGTNARKFRPLGLGYTNLGAYLMSIGKPYDSDGARDIARGITSLMTAEAYLQSSRIAKELGPFEGFEENRDCMDNVIEMHLAEANCLAEGIGLPELFTWKYKQLKLWEEVVESGRNYGFRNAQVTLLAPTGTISFMMDCDTTGIEPEIALVKYKKLVGGGTIKIVNQTVELALQNLGYTQARIRNILDELVNDGIYSVNDEHRAVFQTSLGENPISPMGHIRMVAAVQPFLSGAVSKTINCPNSATIDDIFDIYVEAWKLGLKSITVYRDGCKVIQPLTVKEAIQPGKENRRHLPDTRQSITHKFKIGDHKGYITVGLFEDGNPGEIFVTISKEGSTISGVMDAFATSISMCLQYGVPLEALVRKFSHMRFEPSGFTRNRDIPSAKSIVDYIFQWLKHTFLNRKKDSSPIETPSEISSIIAEGNVFIELDTNICSKCGSIMVRTGNCYSCPSCGDNGGCG